MNQTSHLKGVKKSTFTDEMRKTLCEYKNEHHSSSQKDLQQWVQQTFDLFVSESTISNILKRSFGYLSKEIKNSNVKRHKSAKYPELENLLYEWFLQYQEKVNMTGEMIQTKAKEFLQKMYGDANFEFNFSIGWLERFKARHGIKSYKRFGESGSVFMKNIEYALPQIRAKLKIFDWKDIYNMDETSLFYCLQINVLDAIHFINVAWNIDVKLTTSGNCFRHCKIRSKEDIPFEQKIGDVEGIHKLKEVISNLHYRNAMDQDPDDSSVLPYFSPKEAFLAVDTLKNYLIQNEKNIPDLVYAILKVKDEIVFNSHAKKNELTIDAYFSKE
ncbi:hypothetical protein ES288_A12G023500v1 [Gossypium darwinii]|uniref:HTH CENPB-type domain-containing protein n=1 Tax=Gossypium darwinii TaxID=34276 RepID=A0A5D2E4R3_GOSDA|nr:hypothetical protein ES288_A12G023500v1 [Gossypium darwinii]